MIPNGPIGALVRIRRTKDSKTMTFPSFIACSRFLVKSKPYVTRMYKRGKPLTDAFGNRWEFVLVIEPQKRTDTIKTAISDAESGLSFYEITQRARELMNKPPGKWTHEIKDANGEIALARYEQKVMTKTGVEIVFYRTLDGVKSLHVDIWHKRSKTLRKSKQVREETEE